MARRKKKKKKGGPSPKKVRATSFNNPFTDKKREMKELLKKPKADPKPEPIKQEETDQNLFLAAMADAVPLNEENGTALPQTQSKAPPLEDEELEVLAQLADLVSGAVPLDVRDTDEYVQGCRPDLNPDILHRLSLGKFPIGDHLDLHGETLAQARALVESFLIESRRMGVRCVLIIHGRGLSNPDGLPVLKPHLVNWLSRSGLRKNVLAFATARPYDGGAGALYVLLKK